MGKVLVAARGLPDPVFAQSVVLLVHYDKTGALGLMVNHRTHVPISRALSELKEASPRSRDDRRVRHDSLQLLRQRIYQIVAGYEDANDADRRRHDPTLQIVADQNVEEALGSQPTLSRWENAPSARDLAIWCGFGSAARSCWTSTPPTSPRMASSDSKSFI